MLLLLWHLRQSFYVFRRDTLRFFPILRLFARLDYLSRRRLLFGLRFSFLFTGGYIGSWLRLLIQALHVLIIYVFLLSAHLRIDCLSLLGQDFARTFWASLMGLNPNWFLGIMGLPIREDVVNCSPGIVSRGLMLLYILTLIHFEGCLGTFEAFGYR